MSGHSPLGAVGHVLSTFSSQRFCNDLQSSPRPKSVSNVSKLDLTLPEGDASLARCIPNCPQLEELKVKCDSKGEGNLYICTQITSLIYGTWHKKVIVYGRRYGYRYGYGRN